MSATPYADAVTAAVPEMWWRLNETSGTVIADATGNGHVGTYHGGVSFNQTGGTNDAGNTAIALDGTSAYITSDAYKPFAVGSKRTFSFLVKRLPEQSNPGNIQNFFGGTGEASTTLQFPVFETSGAPDHHFRYYGDISNQFPLYTDWSHTAPLGRYQHIVLTVDQTLGTMAGLQLWLDGVLYGSPDIFAFGNGPWVPWNANSGRFMMGDRYTTGNAPPLEIEYADFAFDEVAIFHRILSAGEIQGLARATGGGAQAFAPTRYRDFVYQGSSPSLYWPLEAQFAANDQSGNGRSGTGAGSISVGSYGSSPIDIESASTNFDGTDDLITSTYNPFAAGTNRTFAGWARRDTSTNVDVIFGGDPGTGHGPLCYLNISTNDFYFSADFASGEWIQWAGVWPGNGIWAHWAVSFFQSVNLVGAYINGYNQGFKAITNDFNGTPGNFQLSVNAAYSSNYPFDGQQAHVAVWERILTPSEHESLYHFGTGLTPAGQQVSAHAAGRGQ